MKKLNSINTSQETFPAKSMIEMHNVEKIFKNASGEFRVLKGIDLNISPGQFVSIVGKSGSGKSTLLNMFTGIDHPSTGQVIVNGTDIYSSMSESDRSLWRGKNLGIVFQFFQLLPMLSLLENVMLPMDYANKYNFDERPQKARELLDQVGLANQSNKLPSSVSTGQQQLAAIARALAVNPPLIVADEPTGNLDTRSADTVIKLFESFVSEGKTVVMVTHDPSLTARTTRNIIISDGELINETVARAFPLLNHRQMLSISKKIEKKVFPSGATIIHQNEHVDKLFVISNGEVEIILEGKNSEEVSIARLSECEYFGEIELMRGGKSIAGVRASSNSNVEILAINRDDFLSLLKESPLTDESITRIIQQRVEENRLKNEHSIFLKLLGKS